MDIYREIDAKRISIGLRHAIRAVVIRGVLRPVNSIPGIQGKWYLII